MGENTGDKKSVECFRFSVDGEGEVTMGRLGTTLPAPKALPPIKVVEPHPPMKVMKAIKVMKAMKRTSTIAKGKKAKLAVWQGKKVKTTKGLKKDDLVKSKGGKVVSAKKSQQGKDSKWSKATAKARAIKGYTGFKAIKKGTSFYDKAKEIMAEL